MTKPSPLLPWNLFSKCSPEKSTGAKFINLPNKSQAPQQGRNLPSYQLLTSADPSTSQEHGRAAKSRAKTSKFQQVPGVCSVPAQELLGITGA